MYQNHYKTGFSVVTHKNKKLVTSLNSNNFELFLLNINSYSYKVGYIPVGYEHRPDLISNLFYGTPTLDWLICIFNNISDQFNQLNAGDRILIPAV